MSARNENPEVPRDDVKHDRGARATPISSATILQGRDAINIEHNGRIYQLRQTKQGKLILTK